MCLCDLSYYDYTFLDRSVEALEKRQDRKGAQSRFADLFRDKIDRWVTKLDDSVIGSRTGAAAEEIEAERLRLRKLLLDSFSTMLEQEADYLSTAFASFVAALDPARLYEETPLNRINVFEAFKFVLSTPLQDVFAGDFAGSISSHRLQEFVSFCPGRERTESTDEGALLRRRTFSRLPRVPGWYSTASHATHALPSTIRATSPQD